MLERLKMRQSRNYASRKDDAAAGCFSIRLYTNEDGVRVEQIREGGIVIASLCFGYTYGIRLLQQKAFIEPSE